MTGAPQHTRTGHHQSHSAGPTPELGAATLTWQQLTDVVCAAVARRVELRSADATPLAEASTAISTEAVFRVHGTALDLGRPLSWAVFLKVLRSPRHWPGIAAVPALLRPQFIAGFPWRVEADALGSDLPDRLPPGIRTPRVLRIDELGDDRVALWLEYVHTDQPTPWPATRYAAAAQLLGRWAGRRLTDRTPTAAGPGYGLRGMTEGLLTHRVFPQLRDGQLWTHPLLATAQGRALRQDLLSLTDTVPALLDALDARPRSIGHGDACPQNLLVPADAPASFVAIDISWQSPEALGFDLAQLLVGRAHTGELPLSDLPALHDTVITAYQTGLRKEGHHVDRADITFGCDTALLIRSAFTALPLEQPPQPTPTHHTELHRRLALTRYLTDRGLALQP